MKDLFFTTTLAHSRHFGYLPYSSRVAMPHCTYSMAKINYRIECKTLETIIEIMIIMKVYIASV